MTWPEAEEEELLPCVFGVLGMLSPRVVLFSCRVAVKLNRVWNSHRYWLVHYIVCHMHSTLDTRIT